MLDKNSLLYEQMQKDSQQQKMYSAQTTATSKHSKPPQNKPISCLPNNMNNLKQMQGDQHGEGMVSSRSEQGFLDGRFMQNGVMSALDTSHKDATMTMIASSNKSTLNNHNNNNINNNNITNNKINTSQSMPIDNKLYSDNPKRNDYDGNQFTNGEEEGEEMNINCNESDGYHQINYTNQSMKGLYKRDVTGQGNIETQGDEEDDEEDTSSEFIKELLQNEKKLTQRIYCSEIKALKVTKIFNDLIFSMKSELLAYLTLEDICRFKKALQYYLGRSVTKTIDTQILKLIWTSESPINNHLLWDTLINYSFIRDQYPFKYEKQVKIINAEHDRNIRMDLDRTFPERDDFSMESNQNKLFRVLNGLSYSVKEIGYIQGWNQITGLFLLYPEFPEDMVFWIINYLMHKVSLKDLYLSIQNAYSTSPSESASEQLHHTPQPSYLIQNSHHQHSHHHNQNHSNENRHKMSSNKYNFDDKENDYMGYNKRDVNQISCSSIEDKQSSSSSDHWGNSAEPNILIKLDFLTYALKVYLKVYLTSVYRQIEKTNYTIYTQKWFTVLFSQQLPPEITLCFFAGIILQDWNYLIKMALAIFDLFKEDILSKNDPDDIMELFYDAFQFTKEQVYNSIQKYEVTNDQLLQIMHLFDEQSDIDNIQLIDGRFYKVEQKQRKEQGSVNSQSSSFFERVGKFFSSTSKQESIYYFEERNEIKYNPIPQGANLDENKFSEIIHYNKLCSKKISKEHLKSPQYNNVFGLSEQKHSVHSQSQQGSINNQSNRPFLEQKTDTSRNQPNNQNNQLPQNNFKASPNFNMNTSLLQAQNNLKLHNQHPHQQNYKPFLSNNQLTTKEKEFDITLQFQSQ